MTATNSELIPSSAPPVNGSGKAQSTSKLKFSTSDRFIRDLRRRVDAYFEETGKSPRDNKRMYFKTATILAWFTAAYVMLLLFPIAWWVAVPLAMIVGLAVAAVGFNIQHDAGHKAYSEKQWVNKAMAFTLDIMGGSSYLWDWKHNTIHHTYPNIDGHDDDIDVGFLGRLSPHQKRYWFHRLQGVYLWFLYGFLAVKWHLVDDFKQLVVAKIGEQKIPRPKGKDLVVFIAGKVVFFSIAFVIPMLMHPWWKVLALYGVAAFTMGIVLSVVFQLAHCVEEAEFPAPVTGPDGKSRMETDWAVHQVQTTVDFARGNRFLSWFLGGLNYQVEHHLFSKICHVHYPELSKVVEEVCREHGVRYSAHDSFFGAIASHWRWLVQMGRPTRMA